MALKGYLASGFQKLIGASRIKGSNDQWVGEPNRVTYSSDTVPITATLLNGFNYVEWTPTTIGTVSNTTALFSSNPTSMVQVTLKNASADKYITISNAGSVAGSCTGQRPLALKPGEVATFIYDIGVSRWVEISRAPETIYLNGTAVNPYVAGGYRREISYFSLAANLTIDTISINIATQAGDTITFINQDSTGIITFQQDPTGSKLIMNGDCALTKYSSITFMYSGAKWVEQSRNMVGGY
jgi:hypothetical protein